MLPRTLAIFLLAACFFPACASFQQRAPTLLQWRPYAVEGTASWYGKRFHGRRTANGERFNMNALTCAHRKLPFGAKVEVTNLSNDKKVVLRVNDRGPYSGRRIIDVSRRAAKKLGFLHRGLVKVRIEWLKPKGFKAPEKESPQNSQKTNPTAGRENW